MMPSMNPLPRATLGPDHDFMSIVVFSKILFFLEVFIFSLFPGGEICGAAELSDLPFMGPAVGAKVQRLMRGVNAAQVKVGAVVATYNKATRAASQIEERLGVLKEQAASIVPTGALGADATPAAEAVKPFPHLLIMQPLKPGSTPFYFNLDTAAFDELKRSSEYRWASQVRLSRRPAQQAVGMGEERITLTGAIFGGFKGGIK